MRTAASTLYDEHSARQDDTRSSNVIGKRRNKDITDIVRSSLTPCVHFISSHLIPPKSEPKEKEEREEEEKTPMFARSLSCLQNVYVFPQPILFLLPSQPATGVHRS
jgi:hypothetical protein